MTSTLQQEGGRKLRLSSSQVMRVAQGLYERGFITYMRTDSVTLVRRGDAGDPRRDRVRVRQQSPLAAAEAVHVEVEERPRGPRGDPPDHAVPLTEAGRGRTQQPGAGALPADLAAHPRLADGRRHRRDGQRPPRRDVRPRADRLRVRSVRHHDHLPRLSGGVRRRRRTATAPRKRCCRRSPRARSSRSTSLTPNGHTTSPPARYTEASLVKRLEELEIGRPSTWASIIQTIQDRGYVWKKGQALVPTWTAFAVVGLLEQHFADLVDYELTAKMDADLDEIAERPAAEGRLAEALLLRRRRRRCSGSSGSSRRTSTRSTPPRSTRSRSATTRTASWSSSSPASTGPYVKRGDDTASVPEDLPPDELDVAKALELLALPKSDEPIGEIDGYPVFAKNGRFGPYVQWGAPDDLPPGLEKPRMSSLFSSMSARLRSRSTTPRSCCSSPARSARTRPTARRSSRTTAATARTSSRRRTSARSTPRSSC